MSTASARRLTTPNFRTIHASYNGGERRRLFSVNFREPDHAEAEPSQPAG